MKAIIIHSNGVSAMINISSINYAIERLSYSQGSKTIINVSGTEIEVNMTVEELNERIGKVLNEA